jgi:23S rRNA (cytidine1920-2'-O)/16S rRNA (cytidine1409-2'-O)-methyltransferase
VRSRRRIDLLLVEKGLEESREKAKASIMAGIVYVGGRRVEKAGEEVDINAQIEIRGRQLKYVSRGGLKLERAIFSFGIDLNNKVCMDVGASTGGFTDCMLQNGAAKVYAVDVGYGQLAWKLRTDSRVINIERTNIRKLSSGRLADEIDFFSIDVSFISLRLVLPVVKAFLTEDAQGVCLIKPQFEAGKEKVGKKGVVRDPAVQAEVIRNICDFADRMGFAVFGLDFSPVKGPEGNIEYLIYLKSSCQNGGELIKIEEVVRNSHIQLDGGATH